MIWHYRHLADESRYDDEIRTMAGAVRFGAENDPDEQQRFSALSTLGALAVLVDPAAAVGKA